MRQIIHTCLLACRLFACTEITTQFCYAYAGIYHNVPRMNDIFKNAYFYPGTFR